MSSAVGGNGDDFIIIAMYPIKITTHNIRGAYRV
jgi:hypothetical protein